MKHYLIKKETDEEGDYYALYKKTPWYAIFTALDLFPLLVYANTVSECMDKTINYLKRHNIEKYKITFIKQ